jgi:prepilin-type N-terminal cleavage/methylation domain-containing protein
MKDLSRHHSAARGFTLIEMLVVLGIIGIFLVASLPSILNSLETRNLENSAREIQTTLQQARFRAVDTRLNHRVRFVQVDGFWRVSLERLNAASVWENVPGFLTKTVSPSFVVTILLPTGLPSGWVVEYSPVGVVQGYDPTHNSVTLQSLKLKGKRQPDLRILQIYGGGSVRLIKTSSA